MSVVKVEEVIEAPVERVFEVFSDIPGASARISGISRIEMLSEGPFGLGTRWKEARTMFGREAVEEMWVTQCDPPRSYTVEAENHGARYLSRYDFIEEGERTRVRLQFGAEGRTVFAKFVGLVFFRFMAKGLCKMLKKDMVELKQACEAGT